MKRLVALLGLLFCADPAPAAELPTHFTRLDLLDGRTLRGVVLKSYDAESDKVLLFVEGRATLVPVKLIPPPFADHFRKQARRSGSSTTVVSNTAPAPRVVPPAKSSPPPSTGPGTGQAAAAAPEITPAADNTLKLHTEAARKRADRFYRYEFQAGSNSITVTAREISIDECEPVSGWKNRYRCKGKAFLEFFDSKGNSFQRTTSEFEVLTEATHLHNAKVIDFTRK